MCVVRSASYADVADVDALLRQAYPRLLRGDYDDKTLEQALPFISRAQPDLVTCGTYYVVHEDGVLLGAGGWTWHAPGTGADTGDAASDIGHIRHVVTDDRATRRGVARHLLSHVFAAAQMQGITQLHCLSTLTAVPFYQAVGFTGGGRHHSSSQPVTKVSCGRNETLALIGFGGALGRTLHAQSQTKKGRPKATPKISVHICRYSRLPKNCSKNMNMLMKLM